MYYKLVQCLKNSQKHQVTKHGRRHRTVIWLFCKIPRHKAALWADCRKTPFCRNSEVSKFDLNSSLEWKPTLFECFCLNRISVQMLWFGKRCMWVLNPQQWVDWYGCGSSSSRPPLFEPRESFSQNGSLNLACVVISEQGTRQQSMKKPSHLFNTFWMKTSSIKCFTFTEMKFTLSSCLE